MRRCLTVSQCVYKHSLLICHPRMGQVCGSGRKKQTPDHLLEAPPLSGSQETAPPGGWKVSRDTGAIGFGCFWGARCLGFPLLGIPAVIPEQSLVLATEKAPAALCCGPILCGSHEKIWHPVALEF